jgi:UDP-2-acetamido-2,6-beta-L-arabino-hexul-4-ose reductase
MRIVVTGADGFIGRNLRIRLQEVGYSNVIAVTHSTVAEELQAALASADFVFHLAGVNRPKRDEDFASGNTGFTERICAVLNNSPEPARVAFASSTQAELENAYGRSKRAAEGALLSYGRSSGAPVYIFRLTNVFGKWCRPNYNSAVATFSHNIARGLPIEVKDPAAKLCLVYIDDVISAFMALLDRPDAPSGFCEAGPTYATTVGEVAALLREFADSRATLLIPRVGKGFMRALHATYISYLPPASFAYQVPRHADPRGVFVEMLKSTDSGQVSYFTAGPGVTRGEHYHHSKTEKFLVIKGRARFGFRHILTGETHQIETHGGESRVVETVPGWTHNIQNIGDDEMIVMLWANEVFDRARPDTVAMKV